MTEPGSSIDCPRCGHLMRSVPTPPPLQRLWRWFNYGGPRRQVMYQCGQCGMGVATSSLYRRTDTFVGRIRQLRRGRSIEPVPRFYATVAAGGLAAGLIAIRGLDDLAADDVVPLEQVREELAVRDHS